MADTSERAYIQEQVQYRQTQSNMAGRHTGAGTVRQTQSNMADTSERADIQEQVQFRQTQSNMADTSERADIQELVQCEDMSSGRHSPTWRTPVRGQTYRSRYMV